MVTKTFSATLHGIEAKLISIEVTIISGAGLFIVGLPDNALRESQHRIESVIKHLGMRMPRQRVIVNLAPASMKKEGASYDLPIALAILKASGQLNLPLLGSYLIAGELSLDGTLCPIQGALSMTLLSKKNLFKGFILPEENGQEALLVDSVPIFPMKHISDVIQFLKGAKKLTPLKPHHNSIFTSTKANTSMLDFKDVVGQEVAKRALVVAAAGGHNLLMIGVPGSGKSMLAQRINSILPPLSLDEALETTQIYSASGKFSPNKRLITERPFRSPHHTISQVALVGGGSIPKPGEISLAHHGILALEELTEFKRSVLEVLRQPLEDKKIQINRAKMGVTFPANFMLVATMNPCPCGYYTNMESRCSCSSIMRKRYLSKISGPLLDRIDLHVQIDPVLLKDIQYRKHSTSSTQLRAEVIKARKFQKDRFLANKFINCNALMPPYYVKKFCSLSKECSSILINAMERLNLSARAYDRICKVSRTIADLSGSSSIEVPHIAEAISYRSLDRLDWLS